MRVKIGNKMFDSEKEPIMVILSKKDKENICNMRQEDTKYCGYPKGASETAIEKFMKE